MEKYFCLQQRTIRYNEEVDPDNENDEGKSFCRFESTDRPVRGSRIVSKKSFRNSFEDETIAASLMETFANHYGLSKILENQIKFGSFAESSQKFRHLPEYLNILRETTNYFINNSSNKHLTMEQRVESSNLPKDRFYTVLDS